MVKRNAHHLEMLKRDNHIIAERRKYTLLYRLCCAAVVASVLIVSQFVC